MKTKTPQNIHRRRGPDSQALVGRVSHGIYKRLTGAFGVEPVLVEE